MRILLLGEYSNVHNTLAEGLRALGHECVVASNGDFWKNYPRDIDLQRKMSVTGNISFLFRLVKALPKMRGFDIVQIINPLFVELKPERITPIYNYIRKHNKKVVLGAFGMDYYWCKVNRDERPMRYSDFNLGDTLRTDDDAVNNCADWIGTPKGELNKYIAKDCDAIVSCLYEYWVTYQAFKDKMRFIPLPIKMPDTLPTDFSLKEDGKLNLFVGISKSRSAYKGTDIMLAAAEAVQKKYPEKINIQIATGVPFDQYKKMMDDSDAILDQLYSYTPAMNSLLAMSKGIVNVGGGEPENYEILGEKSLRPIVNVEPTFESCYKEIENMVLNLDRIPSLKKQSVEYVQKHHDYMKVAKQYEVLYNNLLT